MFRDERNHGKEALLRHREYQDQSNGRRRFESTRPRKPRENTPEEDSLYEELLSYQTNGCTLMMNGRTVRADQVVRACFRERDGGYMRDFVCDEEEDKVQEIHFDRVR